MKNFLLLFFFVQISYGQTNKDNISRLLTDWHRAAAGAQFEKYFEMFSDDAIFIGTDPTENWNIPTFKSYAQPFFDRGKAWDFTAVERNIFISPDGKMAWFDELLDTPNMKLCRGSGVLKKENGKWKIAHYVLSIAIPNDLSDEVVQLKSAFDNILLEESRKQ